MAKDKPSIPKGTRDFLPAEMAGREFIFDTLRSTFRRFGYQALETPSMEQLSVLTGKYGEEGDRLIFKILDSGDFMNGFHSDEDLLAAKAKGPAHFATHISSKALRYDLTIPFARVVVMHQNELTFPFRRYQIQPVWRADRPQKGRYREFYQCDCDVIGSDSLLLDAELVSVYDTAFAALGFKGIRLLINNRKILSGLAEIAGQKDKVTDICVAIDKLDKVGEEGVRKELSERGIGMEGIDKIFALASFAGNNAEKIAHFRAAFASSETGMRGLAEMEEVLGYLPGFKLSCAEVIFDLTLARGLDYYTGTIYEVKAKDIAFGSIGGGGRYDDLTGTFGLPGLSGVGISFGADRIYDVMRELGLLASRTARGTQALVIHFGANSLKGSLDALYQLRAAGIAAEIYPDAIKVGKQFAYADKKNIPFVIVVGEQELAGKVWKVKNLATGVEESLSPEAAIEKLKQA